VRLRRTWAGYRLLFRSNFAPQNSGVRSRSWYLDPPPHVERKRPASAVNRSWLPSFRSMCCARSCANMPFRSTPSTSKRQCILVSIPPPLRRYAGAPCAPAAFDPLRPAWLRVRNYFVPPNTDKRTLWHLLISIRALSHCWSCRHGASILVGLSHRRRRSLARSVISIHVSVSVNDGLAPVVSIPCVRSPLSLACRHFDPLLHRSRSLLSAFSIHFI